MDCPLESQPISLRDGVVLVLGHPPPLISSASLAELVEIKVNRGFMQLSSNFCPCRPCIWINQTLKKKKEKGL